MSGKIIIKSTLKVVTGLHIGDSDAFSAIGAVDSQVIKDRMTGRPIIPGSSLKGKIRTLLARSEIKDIGAMPEHNKDKLVIKRLFGSSDPVKSSRLQFSDCFVSNFDKMKAVGLTEVKAENGIDRLTSVANPRFIERVNAGTEFAVCIVYNVEKSEDVSEDMKYLAKGIKLLQMDYLGGHGSRGSGRVDFSAFTFEFFETDYDLDSLKEQFKEVESYELLSV